MQSMAKFELKLPGHIRAYKFLEPDLDLGSILSFTCPFVPFYVCLSCYRFVANISPVFAFNNLIIPNFWFSSFWTKNNFQL